MSSDPPAIASDGLGKRFGHQQVVVDLALDVPRGACYGFIGPNGSGKTTTIRMLLGLVRPDAGSCSLLGEPMPSAAASVLPRVGALVEGPAFHPYLSGLANLLRVDAADATSDRATSRSRVGTALERVGLIAAANKRYRAYSLGMRQRLGIAQAIMEEPSLMILDEPMNGLDKYGVAEMRSLFQSLTKDGRTILLASHNIQDIETLCDTVCEMDAGVMTMVRETPLKEGISL